METNVHDKAVEILQTRAKKNKLKKEILNQMLEYGSVLYAETFEELMRELKAEVERQKGKENGN